MSSIQSPEEFIVCINFQYNIFLSIDFSLVLSIDFLHRVRNTHTYVQFDVSSANLFHKICCSPSTKGKERKCNLKQINKRLTAWKILLLSHLISYRCEKGDGIFSWKLHSSSSMCKMDMFIFIFLIFNFVKSCTRWKCLKTSHRIVCVEYRLHLLSLIYWYQGFSIFFFMYDCLRACSSARFDNDID